jgi:uncharacterized membrane protein YeaQ/YmgE (transglycosylase-associated protein family)
MTSMGIGCWIGAGIAAAIVARLLPFVRRAGGWLRDFVVGIAAALLAGLIATALDFGGWAQPDWRAALFAFASALAVLGWLRAVSGFLDRRVQNRTPGA